MRPIADLQSFFRRQSAPVTVCLISAMVVVSVGLFLFHSMGDFLIVTQATQIQPWVYVTYPFAQSLQGTGVIQLLFLCYWLYWVGGSIESDLGALRLGILWAVASVLEAICVVVVALMLHEYGWGVAGALLPVALLTCIWGVRNRDACVRLMMIIPINGFWMAWLSAAIVFVEFGRQHLLLGAAACVPLVGGWLYASNRIPKLAYGKPAIVYRPSKAQQAKESAFFDDVRKREQERQDRERLRKMFEGSIKDD